ncbi:MAG: hypothetical protein FJ276_37905, partial [Planctomycetes bacterium]|nr:hypothetical protein [Planctomycetota bacterium]
MFPLRHLFRLGVSVVLVLLCTALVSTVSNADAGLVSVDAARRAAVQHVQRIAEDFPEDFRDAVVSEKPLVCFDSAGNPSAYVFELSAHGQDRGYVTTSALATVSPVIESSNGPSPRAKAMRIFADAGYTQDELSRDLASSDAQVIYVGGIDYYLVLPQRLRTVLGAGILRLRDLAPVDGDSITAMRLERNSLLLEPQRVAEAESAWAQVVSDHQEPAEDKSTPDGLAAPSITVTYPNAANIFFNRGSSYTIRWTSNQAGANVRIELFKGGTLSRTIVTSTSNNGSYAWNVRRTILSS